jgi:hypothetical protein
MKFASFGFVLVRVRVLAVLKPYSSTELAEPYETTELAVLKYGKNRTPPRALGSG